MMDIVIMIVSDNLLPSVANIWGVYVLLATDHNIIFSVPMYDYSI